MLTSITLRLLHAHVRKRTAIACNCMASLYLTICRHSSICLSLQSYYYTESSSFPSYFLWSKNMVSNSTAIKKHRHVWPMTSASHTTNLLLEGPHFTQRGSQTYRPAITHTHHPYYTSQVLWPHCTCCWSIHGHSRALRSSMFPLQRNWNCRSTDHVKFGSGQLNPMLLYSSLVWQLPITKHKSIGMEGTRWNGNVHWTSHMMWPTVWLVQIIQYSVAVVEWQNNNEKENIFTMFWPSLIKRDTKRTLVCSLKILLHDNVQMVL